MLRRERDYVGDSVDGREWKNYLKKKWRELGIELTQDIFRVGLF
jgi:hypothetical protein